MPRYGAILTMLGLAWTTLSPQASTLRVGAAVRVISPEKPVHLAGLKNNPLSTGVHDDIYARALAIEQGETTLILVGLDIMGYRRPDVLRVTERIAAQGVPTENLIIAATHQHSGPDTIGLWGPSPTVSGVDPEYMAFLAERLVEAVVEAYNSRREAVVSFGTRTIPSGVARNARIPGYFDHELRVLHFTEPDGSTIGTLVNFTAHPETLGGTENTLVTAGYPQFVYQLVEEEFGGTTVFLNGALGGMVTVDEKESTFDEIERIGSAVGCTAIEAIRDAERIEEPTLRVSRSVFRSPMTNEKFLQAIEIGLFDDWLEDGDVVTEVNLIRLGPVGMATVPGELLPKLGFQIRDAMREKLGVASPFILGLANDELGYILPEEEFDSPLYSYESTMSIGPRIGTDVVRQLIALMDAAAE